MSSSLFGRGTFSQIGGAHRAEQIRKEFDQIWTALKALAELPAIVEEMSGKLETLTKRLDALGAPQIKDPAEDDEPQPATQAQIEELNSKIEALMVLGFGSVTQASLTALEKRLNAKLESFSQSHGSSGGSM
jgi:uncharacterized coiled-coil protein SlyX